MSIKCFAAIRYLQDWIETNGDKYKQFQAWIKETIDINRKQGPGYICIVFPNPDNVIKWIISHDPAHIYSCSYVNDKTSNAYTCYILINPYGVSMTVSITE